MVRWVTRVTAGQRFAPPSRTLQAKASTPIDAPGTGREATNKVLLRARAAAGDWIAASDQLPLNEGDVNETHGGTEGGMWKWTGTVLAVIDAVPSSSAGRLIHSSYPNPFNPAATIEFSLPEAAHTSPRIYNSAGSEVATLIDRPLREGPHAVQWHAQEQASGVYFYRLQAKSAVVSGAMVLAK